jgi:hypothetical protein
MAFLNPDIFEIPKKIAPIDEDNRPALHQAPQKLKYRQLHATAGGYLSAHEGRTTLTSAFSASFFSKITHCLRKVKKKTSCRIDSSD